MPWSSTVSPLGASRGKPASAPKRSRTTGRPPRMSCASTAPKRASHSPPRLSKAMPWTAPGATPATGTSRSPRSSHASSPCEVATHMPPPGGAAMSYTLAEPDRPRPSPRANRVITRPSAPRTCTPYSPATQIDPSAACAMREASPGSAPLYCPDHQRRTSPVRGSMRASPSTNVTQTCPLRSSSAACRMKPSPTFFTACSTAPVSGSRRSSTPPLPTSHTLPSREGAMPRTCALASVVESSRRRASTENWRQRGGRYHRPLELLANQSPPSRSSCASTHEGRTRPCAAPL